MDGTVHFSRDPKVETDTSSFEHKSEKKHLTVLTGHYQANLMITQLLDTKCTDMYPLLLKQTQCTLYVFYHYNNYQTTLVFLIC